MRNAVVATEDGVRGIGIGVGGVSLSMGLTLALRRTSSLLGWGERGRLGRTLGVVDLVVGMGLLAAPRPSRWMLARTLLNVVIGGIYGKVLSAGMRHRGRAIPGLCLMGALTANDFYPSLRLRGIEDSYNPPATR